MSKAPRVWITRTQPGADATASRLRQMGWEPVVVPLLEVRAINGAMNSAPAPDEIACLALTSPNTIDTIRGDLAAYRDVPTFAVGDATAECARNAGLTNVQSAKGDIQALARLIASQIKGGTVFAPGAQEPAGDLPALLPTLKVIRLAVYETVPTDADAPDAIDAILIHSPRAARLLAKQMQGQSGTNARVVTISKAAAAPLRDIFAAEIHIAVTPDEDAVLRTLGNSASPV